MLKSKIERFVAKRVLISFIVLAILDILLMRQKWFILIGLFVGSIISVLKFGSYALVFNRIFLPTSDINKQKQSVKKSLIFFIATQFLILPVLYFALKFNPYFFAGLVGGILLVPLVLFINCFTEGLNITHNNFE